MDYELKDEDGIVTFTIMREAKHNAINHQVMDGLQQAIEYVQANKQCKLLVITGQGEKSFCSGGDLSELHTLRTEDQAYGMLSKMGKILYRLATLEIPTIALVNGTAVGGGCEIATACDFRLVSAKAKAGFIQGTLAITTGWGGGTFLFERGLKSDDALSMLLEAKPLLADRLIEVGWASKLYNGNRVEALHEYIEQMKLIHSDVHRAYKKIVVRKWERTQVYERMLEEIRSCAILWEQDAHHLAVQNFLNKRK